MAVFFSGLLLWVLSVVVTELTANPNLIPTVVMVGLKAPARIFMPRRVFAITMPPECCPRWRGRPAI